MPKRLYSVKSVGAYLARRDNGWKCHYCGCKVKREPSDRAIKRGVRPATVDHMKPLSHGGSDSVQNLVLACRPCNDAKKDMGYFEFWQILYARQL